MGRSLYLSPCLLKDLAKCPCTQRFSLNSLRDDAQLNLIFVICSTNVHLMCCKDSDTSNSSGVRINVTFTQNMKETSYSQQNQAENRKIDLLLLSEVFLILSFHSEPLLLCGSDVPF